MKSPTSDIEIGVSFTGNEDGYTRFEWKANIDLVSNEWIRKREEEAFETCGEKSWNFRYLKRGLFGEIGEASDLVKRVIRGDFENKRDEFKTLLIKELGDVQWYAVMLNRWFSVRSQCQYTIPVLHKGNQKDIYVSNDIDEMFDWILARAVMLINIHKVKPLLATLDALAKLYNSSNEEVGEINYQKLKDRFSRNVIKGSGDNR